ncbi:MYG1 family protein [Paracoccus marcusii]|uniref:MYG1 family protein n=1 Tax=Paracoccus marcusii TaxID=59779 RepID=A0ABY7UNW6_9RHOB|nr:MYG1 family protein [Paracoccus marcusii]WDA11628.1 MYG1 family protein [Paracoccus marcusii]
MTVTHLVTHSGGFHADEVLSSVILTRLHPQARIMRTRDADWITPAEGRIIYDVGRDFDAARMIFDHHQKSPPLRDDGQPYSSFGLIWRQFGRDYLAALQVPAADLEAIHAAIDADLVLPIDLVDNGALSPTGPLADLSLPMLLESLKPVFDDRSPDADDRAFDGAVAIARAFVEAAVARKAAKHRAEAVVMAAIAAAGDGRVLELPMGMPFRSAITAAGADHLLFVIHPRDTDWALTGIRRDADGFALRADLPAAWAGLTDGAFEAASGVPGVRFCHNARFIAVAADRDAALRLADLAVAASEV